MRLESERESRSWRDPRQITVAVITDILADKPLLRKDQGKDFVEFAIERLNSDYARNRIGRSRLENGKSGMNIFQTFLRAKKLGTYRPDSIYVGDITPELVDAYIEWRRDVKKNSDATINHALTPILKACSYASDLGLIDPAINLRIQDMRVITKLSLTEEGFEGTYTDTYYQHNEGWYNPRQFRLGLTWRFGKTSINFKHAKKTEVSDKL